MPKLVATAAARETVPGLGERVQLRYGDGEKVIAEIIERVAVRDTDAYIYVAVAPCPSAPHLDICPVFMLRESDLTVTGLSWHHRDDYSMRPDMRRKSPAVRAMYALARDAQAGGKH
jgi:hypothetical protein